MAAQGNYASGTMVTPNDFPLGKSERPKQTVSLKEKLGSGKEPTEWMKRNMDFFTSMWHENAHQRRRKIINYKLVNGEFSFSEFGKDPYTALINYDTNSIGELSEDLVHYPICTIPLQQLWGEEAQRPFNFVAIVTDEENRNQYLRDKTDLLHQFVLQEINTKIQGKLIQMGIDPESQEGQEQAQAMTPPQIEDFMRRKYSTADEKSANLILKKYVKDLYVPQKFNKGWTDATKVAEEYYYVGTYNGKTVFECVNPVSMVTDTATDSDFIDESEWIIRGEMMTPSQIIDRWTDDLSLQDVKDIESYNVFSSKGVTTALQSIDNPMFNTTFIPYQSSDNQRYPLTFLNPGDPNSAQDWLTNSQGGSFPNSRSQNHILVLHAEWMSKREIMELTYYDEEGTEQVEFLDASIKNQDLFKEFLDKIGGTYRTFYVNEVWEGTKIGDLLYKRIRPKENQFRSINKLSGAKFGYTGLRYNNRNSVPYSLLDSMKPMQSLYNFIMAQLKQDYQSELGNILLFDLAQVPVNNGWNFDKWWNFIRKEKVAFLNQFAEGQRSNFNQFQIMRSSLADSIKTKVELLNYLEQKCWAQAGVNAPRLGDVSGINTATGIREGIERSYAQTEYQFKLHNSLKERALTLLINEVKFNIKEDTEDTYFLDDMSVAFIKTSQGFQYSDTNVYITDSSKDQKTLEIARQLVQPALQNGMDFSTAFTVLSEDSLSVIKEQLEKIDEYNKRAAEAEMKYKQEELQKREALEREKMERVDRNEQLNRESNERIAEDKILASAALGSKDTDLNDNNVPDVFEVGKLNLETSRLAYDNLNQEKEFNERQKDRSQQEKDRKSQENIKNKEMANKLKVEREKTKQVVIQNKSQEKLAKQADAQKDKELRSKEKIEKIKAKTKKTAK